MHFWNFILCFQCSEPRFESKDLNLPLIVIQFFHALFVYSFNAFLFLLLAKLDLTFVPCVYHVFQFHYCLYLIIMCISLRSNVLSCDCIDYCLHCLSYTLTFVCCKLSTVVFSSSIVYTLFMIFCLHCSKFSLIILC